MTVIIAAVVVGAHVTIRVRGACPLPWHTLMESINVVVIFAFLHGLEEEHLVVQQSSSGSQRPPCNGC